MKLAWQGGGLDGDSRVNSDKAQAINLRHCVEPALHVHAEQQAFFLY